MGAHTSGSGDDDVISEINVTPLVDVILVLLVIFMITAPVIYNSSIKVDLPAASTGEKNAKSTQFNFVINQQGDLYWNDERLPWEQVQGRMNSLSDQDKANPVSISADSKSEHGLVVRLMDILRKNGLTRFALNVSQN